MPDDRKDSPSETSTPAPGSQDFAGLSVRDYFAGLALAGMCSASAEPAHGLAMQRKMAETAFQLADAMVARRDVSGDR